MQTVELLQQKYQLMLTKKLNDVDSKVAFNCLTKTSDFETKYAPVFNKFVFLQEEVVDLADILMQLDKQYLKNFLRSQLLSKQVPTLILFFSKVFVLHIGNIVYTSKSANLFDMAEKTFDKFMEACIYVNVQFEEMLPMFFEILKSSQTDAQSKWKRPVTDFCVDYINKNEKNFLKIVFENFDTVGIDSFNFLLSQNIAFAIPRLVDFWLNNEFSLKRQVKNILKQHFSEVYEYYLSLVNHNEISALKRVELLSIFRIEEKAKAELEAMFFKEKDKNVKQKILENIEIKFKSDVASNMQFRKNCLKYENLGDLVFLSKKIDEFPLLCYAKSTEGFSYITEYILTEYSNLFSPKQCEKLAYFSQFLDRQSLDSFVGFVFNLLEQRGFVETDDWALTLVAQNASGQKLVEIFRQLSKYKRVPVFVVNKFVKLLCVIKREDLISCALQLDRSNKKENEILQTIFLKAEQSENYSLSCIENARDLMVPSFGFDENGHSNQKGADIFVDQNLNVSMSLEIPNDLVENYAMHFVKGVEKEIEKQSQRLYRAFLCGRKWTKPDFSKVFLKGGILNLLAQRLLFGKYQNGKLMAVFEIDGLKICDIESFVTSEDDKTQEYGIFHSVDYPENDFSNNFYRGKPPFNQLNREISLQSTFNMHSSTVLRFKGMVVQTGSFFSRLCSNGWILGLPTFDNYTDKLIKYNRDLDMVCEIDFDPIRLDKGTGQTTVLDELRFYRAKNVICTGNNWVPNKLNSLEIGVVDARLFSDIIFELASAGKK